ncbi:MAG TPA: glutathione S-transferase family protein [Alphaproteobacteria bacterium]|jgi:glutathione S-transferase|nr:glutathione S-transferase family protein [Alphaproteobacteria bacterium]MDP6271274.1 glutathione S-transferase family protein [Alphaproteobacteria bacterium]HJM50538.1 glutathione S-transferase family protein [Alphaproteobacteria bacterium]
MNDIILHHYPQSPVSEKVRVGLGIKGLAWRSVEIPRLPPKPDLVPLTGGYRRTPVMQIGADVYCDSLAILRELERRFPEPSFEPAGGAAGLAWGFSRWTDGEFFDLCVKLVLGASLADLPPEFAADRGRLYLGPDWNLEQVAAELPLIVAQVRAQFGWLAQLAGSSFLAGADPGLADALGYYLVWFVRGRWAGGPEMLAEFPELEAWEARVAEIGHGQPSEMTAAEALDIAHASEPAPPLVDSADPQALAGRQVSVVPDVDGGDPEVRGPVHGCDREFITVSQENERVGRIAVHFPRVGYRVTLLDGD